MTNSISVVVVTYRQEAMLGQCLESILPQLGGGDEVLVCDDRSPDGTVAVAKRYAAADARVKVLEAAENGGVSRNANRGLEAARGDYVAIIAGDDLFLPGKLAKQSAVLAADPGCSLCYHDVWITDSALQLREPRPLGRFHPEGTGTDALFMSRGNFIPGPAGMIRRSLAGDVRFDPRFDMCSDRLFWAVCARRGRVRYLDERLALYRRHDDSMTTRRRGRARRAYDAAMAMFDVAEAEEGIDEAAVARGRALAGWRLVKDALRSRSAVDLREGARHMSAPVTWARAVAWDVRPRVPR